MLFSSSAHAREHRNTGETWGAGENPDTLEMFISIAQQSLINDLQPQTFFSTANALSSEGKSELGGEPFVLCLKGYKTTLSSRGRERLYSQVIPCKLSGSH